MGNKDITYTAEEYDRTKKESSFRDAVEMHTIFSLIGNPTGLYTLDAGCGDGIYARELIDRGARHITGVDCAEDFIEMANQKMHSSLRELTRAPPNGPHRTQIGYGRSQTRQIPGLEGLVGGDEYAGVE